MRTLVGSPLISLAVSVAACTALRAASPPPSDPPSDACILQIVTHARATLEVDGTDYGAKRQLTFKPLTPGESYSTRVIVRYPDGRTFERPFTLVGGKLLRDTIGPPPSELFEFRDEYAPPPSRVAETLLKKMPYSVKPWPEDKKRAVRRWLDEVEEAAPYLMVRATAYRPVRVYLSPDPGLRVAEVWVDSHALIIFEPTFAVAERIPSSGARFLTHEITHLADSPRTISSREDWDRATRSRIDRVWQAFRTETGRDAAEVWIKAKETGLANDDSASLDRLAAQQGLPGGYASYAVYEALAECAAAYLWKDYTPPPEIVTVLDERLLAPAFLPNPALLRIHDALSAAERNDLPGSLALLDEAVAADPREAWAFLFRGKAREVNRQRDPALQDYTEAVRLNPRLFEAYSARGKLLAAAGRHADAVEDLSRAIELNPLEETYLLDRAGVYRSLKKYDEAIADYDRLITLKPGAVGAIYSRGDVRLETNRYREAEADFSELIKLFDKAPELKAIYGQAYERRARALIGLNRFEEAIADLSAVSEMAPDFLPVYFMRGDVYRTIKKYDEAIADYDRLIGKMPSPPAFLYYNRGLCRRGKSEPDKALADFNAALARDPKYVAAYLDRARLHVDRGDTTTALADLDQAVKTAPTDPDPYYVRAAVRNSVDDLDGSIADYSKVIELNPDDPRPYINRSNVYGRQNDYRLQIRDLESAVRIDPTRHAPYVTLAWIFATTPDAAIRDGRKAVEAATKACELSEWKEATDLGNLACAYAEAGDFAAAVQWQKKAEELYTPQMREKWGFLLKLYQSGKPYHQTAPDAKSP